MALNLVILFLLIASSLGSSDNFGSAKNGDTSSKLRPDHQPVLNDSSKPVLLSPEVSKNGTETITNPPHASISIGSTTLNAYSPLPVSDTLPNNDTTTTAPSTSTTPITPNTTTTAPSTSTTPITPNTTTTTPPTSTTPKSTTTAPPTTTTSPTPITPNTTTTTPPTSTTPKTTTTAPSTTTTPTTPTTPNTTTTAPSTSTTLKPSTTTLAPAPVPDRHFDGPSFIGGIVLALGMMSIGFVAWKFYKARHERNYHTLSNFGDSPVI